jgi:nickel-dependent lactate racemase
MSTVKLAYGDASLDLNLDDSRFDVTVISPRHHQALSDPKADFRKAVEAPIGAKPLAHVVATKRVAGAREIRSVVIAVADHTRPVPDGLLVPWIVEALGVPDSVVTVLIGTGTHRGSTEAEILKKYGPENRKRFTFVNHDCQDENSLKFIGTSKCGGPCWINRLWTDADIKIVTGFIEPHFFAGFSGGPKGVVPAIAGMKTIQHFHRAMLIAHPNSTWGDLETNPLQALTREMSAMCPPDFMVNVTLNLEKQITGVFAGDMLAAHVAGCKKAAVDAVVQVNRAFPVVVTTNSGYPLDQNFYQTIKGISAAARIVAPGGAIVVASECRNGMPPEGEFRSIMADPRGSKELLQAILKEKNTRHDQWQAQTMLQCLQKARVVLYSGLSPADQAATRAEISKNLNATLDELQAAAIGKLPVAVLPMGPLTIPMLAQGATAR